MQTVCSGSGGYWLFLAIPGTGQVTVPATHSVPRMAVTTLESLPEELLLAVLERVEGRGLATMAAVSRVWRRIATSQRFHLKVDTSMTPDKILEKVVSLPAVRSVTLQDRQMRRELLVAMVDHPTLEAVHVVEEGEGDYQDMHCEVIHRLLYGGQLEGRLPGQQVIRSEHGRDGDGKMRHMKYRTDPRSSKDGKIRMPIRVVPKEKVLKLWLAHCPEMARTVTRCCDWLNKTGPYSAGHKAP